MPNLTQITVRYARKISTAPYESADAEVSLTFGIQEGEDVDTDDAILDAMASCVNGVCATLNVDPLGEEAPADAPEPKKPAARRALPEEPAQDVGGGIQRRKAPAPAKAAEVKQKPAPAPAKAAEVKQEDAGEPTPGDVTDAIAHALDRMRKAGIQDGSKRVMGLVAEFLPDAKPPKNTARYLEDNQRAPFIERLAKLGTE